jgi:hypothetical protein
MSDGEDNVVDLNTQILISIRDEIVRTRAELREEIAGTRAELREELAGTRADLRNEIAATRNDLGARMATLEAETIRGFTGVRFELDLVNRRLDQTNQRLDNLVDVTGGSHRDHEVRIKRLETTLAGMRRRRPRT